MLVNENTAGQSTATMVLHSLRTAILHNQLHGGERLLQDAIATRFGVSQMIVREAFKQLATEGFVRVEPRRGVSVSLLSADEAWEITQLRAVIEAQALRWAIPNMVRKDYISYKQILDELDVVETVDQRIALNAAFHERLYAPARRARTFDLINTLRRNFERYLRFTWEETHHMEQSQQEHRQILDLCELRDTERACDTLRKHVLATGDLLVESLLKAGHE